MRYAHYLVYENDNGWNRLNIIYNAIGMPDINLLILNELCILNISERTVFCAVVHSFLCIMGRREGWGSGVRGQVLDGRSQKVEDGGSESEKVRSLEEDFAKSRLRFLTIAILPQKEAGSIMSPPFLPQKQFLFQGILTSVKSPLLFSVELYELLMFK